MVTTEMVAFVSCAAQKLATRSAAQELYISQLFRKSRQFVETLGCRWFILSAKHGLLDPRTEVEPYELSLDRMGVIDRRRWSNGVISLFDELALSPKIAVILAGKPYREYLVPHLDQRGIKVDVPMAGLKRGPQLQWLTNRLKQIASDRLVAQQIQQRASRGNREAFLSELDLVPDVPDPFEPEIV